MKRGKALKRGQPMRRGKRVKPVSDKRRAENEDRRDAMLIVRGRIYCEVCPVLLAGGIDIPPAQRGQHHGRDGHEVVTRGRRGSITDLDNIRYACRPSHEWVTNHPAAAKALGLVASNAAPPTPRETT